MMGRSPRISLIGRIASTPVPSGSFRSVITRSNSLAATWARPARTVAACSTR
jgi:hypothetical protein